ncbi:MAG TPA: hypothetical protein VF680_16810 [Allosphingosinicella sp.]|jgi:hypothetical protein
MTIECNEIQQVGNELLIAFQDCNKIKNSDLRKLVELVLAVSTCNNGGPDYNTLITEVYEPVSDQVITYEPNSFHSVSIMVLAGNIEEESNLGTVTYPTGTVLNTEFTNLNQTTLTFTVVAGSQVVVKYLIETV